MDSQETGNPDSQETGNPESQETGNPESQETGSRERLQQVRDQMKLKQPWLQQACAEQVLYYVL